MVRRQHSAKDDEPVIECVHRRGFRYWFAENSRQPIKIVVRFGKFLVGVVENVLHVRNSVSHVDRQRGAVFAAGQA